MSFKTIFIIILTILVTLMIVMNNQPVKFNFIFFESDVPKLFVMGACTIAGFIIGLIVARPKRKATFAPTHHEKDVPLEINHPRHSLSDEDKDYIS